MVYGKSPEHAEPLQSSNYEFAMSKISWFSYCHNISIDESHRKRWESLYSTKQVLVLQNNFQIEFSILVHCVRLSEQRHQQILYITTAMNTLEKKAKDVILNQVNKEKSANTFRKLKNIDSAKGFLTLDDLPNRYLPYNTLWKGCLSNLLWFLTSNIS